MKKMVIGLMVLVMMFAVVNAVAEIYPTYEEALRLLDEWGRTYGYLKCVNKEADGDMIYYTGVMDKSEYEEHFGCEATEENFVRVSLEEIEGMYEITSRRVGEIDGHAVYYCEAHSNGSRLCDEYYHCGVLWMVCD